MNVATSEKSNVPPAEEKFGKGDEIIKTDPDHGESSKITSGNFREASYFVLFIGAVFITNAMETGSYRTPWPVAIVTTLIGVGMFAYSLYLQSR